MEVKKPRAICTICGAEFLESTAKETGGPCRRCLQDPDWKERQRRYEEFDEGDSDDNAHQVSISFGNSAIADALINDPFSRTDNPRVWAILVSKMIDSLDELQELCEIGETKPMRVLAKLDDIRDKMPKEMADMLQWKMSSAILRDEDSQLQECGRRSKQLTDVVSRFLNRQIGGKSEAYLDAFLKYGREGEGASVASPEKAAPKAGFFGGWLWHVVVAFGLLVALGKGRHLDYGYFMLLRFAVCAAFGFWACEAHKAGKSFWRNAFGLIALLYNPFFPVKLGDEELWARVNLATLGMVVASWRVLKRGNAAVIQ